MISVILPHLVKVGFFIQRTSRQERRQPFRLFRELPQGKNMAKTAIITLAHGSRLSTANNEVEKLVEIWRQQKQERDKLYIYTAFMQFGTPSLGESIKEAVKEGCKEILIAPLFLTSGAHITNDIPEIVSQMREQHPTVHFRQCPPLGSDERLLNILWDRVKEHLPSKI